MKVRFHVLFVTKTSKFIIVTKMNQNQYIFVLEKLLQSIIATLIAVVSLAAQER